MGLAKEEYPKKIDKEKSIYSSTSASFQDLRTGTILYYLYFPSMTAVHEYVTTMLSEA